MIKPKGYLPVIETAIGKEVHLGAEVYCREDIHLSQVLQHPFCYDSKLVELVFSVSEA